MDMSESWDLNLCEAKVCDEESVRKPYSGNLYLRFGEGSGVTPAPTPPVSFFSFCMDTSENKMLLRKMRAAELAAWNNLGRAF